MTMEYVLICLAVISFTVGRLVVHAEGLNFTYFTFTQSWPPGTCAQGKIDGNTCRIPDNVTTWTIHGLWPSSKGGTSPSQCNTSLKFDYSQIKSMEPQLDKYWPNLFTYTNHTSFWQHEWFTHGTCAVGYNKTPNEYSYFNIGLQLNEKYNITKMLENANIFPKKGSTFSHQQFEKAVKNTTGALPRIQCTCPTQDGKKKTTMMYQIEICLNLDLKPMSCPKDRKLSGGKPDNPCRSCYNFTYPPIQHG